MIKYNVSFYRVAEYVFSCEISANDYKSACIPAEELRKLCNCDGYHMEPNQ